MVMPSEEERVAPTVRNPRVPRFPVVIAEPTFDQVRDNISSRDYSTIAVLGATCFPLGYLMGRHIDRRLAMRGLWFTGILGTVGGVMLAYQNTELRLRGYGRNDAEVARYGIQPRDQQHAESSPTETE